jgi:hypothetical protein
VKGVGRGGKLLLLNGLLEDVVLGVCVDDDNKLGENVSYFPFLVDWVWPPDGWSIVDGEVLPGVFVVLLVVTS